MGPDHPDLVPQVMSLAVAQTRLGDLAGAAASAKEAADLAFEVLPEQHPLLGVTALNLGKIYLRMERTTQARPLLESAVSQLETSLGEEHPNTAFAKIGLAELELMDQRRHESADLYTQALATLKQSLPADHTHIADTSMSLADVLVALDQDEGQDLIVPLLLEAARIYAIAFGEDDERTVAAREKAASRYQSDD